VVDQPRSNAQEAMMALRVEKDDVREPVELSRDELRDVFEHAAHSRLNMSGDEFLRRLDEGTLPDSPAVDEVAILVGGDNV
jgi:hypothetical protein